MLISSTFVNYLKSAILDVFILHTTSSHSFIRSIHSFIHSRYFYSASLSPLLLRGAPDYSIDTVSELTHRSVTGNTSEGLAQGPYTWRLEWDSGRKATNLSLSHNDPYL